MELRVLPNWLQYQTIENTARDVREGGMLSESLRQQQLFPPLALLLCGLLLRRPRPFRGRTEKNRRPAAPVETGPVPDSPGPA